MTCTHSASTRAKQGDLAGYAGMASGLPSRSFVRAATLSFLCMLTLLSLSNNKSCCTGVRTRNGPSALSCALSPLLVEAIVAAGVASSDGSVALGWEPSCSSSVLPIVMGEVGDSLASGLTGSGTSVGGAGSALSSELVSLRLCRLGKRCRSPY